MSFKSALRQQTFYVRGLPPDTTQEDIRSHFSPLSQGCHIAVGPIVNRYSEDHSTIRSRSTTVTFSGPSTSEIEDIVARIARENLYSDTNAGSIYFDKEFYGLNILDEHNNPTRESVFF